MTINNTTDAAQRPDTDVPLDLWVEVTCDNCGKTTLFPVNRDHYTA